MELRNLRYFVTVAEELHFGRAAERLHMTQPPLSQAIQALEEEIGVKLFERTKRSVELTPVGEKWLQHVRALLRDAATLPGIARRLSRGEVGSLKLAFVSIADYSVLPTLVSRYKETFPDVEISLREATSDIQIEALLNKEIDAGLIIPPPSASLHVSLSYLPLVRDPLVVAVPSVWIEAGRIKCRGSTVQLKHLKEIPLILFPRRSAPALHDIITGSYAVHGIEPRLGQEAIQMQTILSLVSAGMGIALVPRSLENLGRTGVRYLKLRGGAPPQIETGVAWRREDQAPTVRQFIKLASAMAGESR